MFPIFHTSLLTPYRANQFADRVQEPPAPVVIDGDEEYEIERIVDYRKQRGNVQYLVKWLGYPLDKKNDWISEDGLCHAQDLLADFCNNYKSQPPNKRRQR